MNYKIIIPLFTVMAIPATVHAQQVNWFEAEQSVFYEVKGCVTGSDVLFFSERSGGKTLKKITANEAGELVFTMPLHRDIQRPAAIVNTKDTYKKYNSRKAGTGKVVFFEAKEFSLSNITLLPGKEQVTLNWQADVNPAEDIAFEVLKSMDGKEYRVAETIKASKYARFVPYFFTEKTDPLATYKIRVLNLQKGNRYTSKALTNDTWSVQVYPTVMNNSIYITLDNQYNDASFRMINEQGQLIQSGRLDKKENVVSLPEIAAGKYIISVQAGGKKSVSRIIKL